MSHIIPKKFKLDDNQKIAIGSILESMYEECYIGHIPPEQWTRFATFCFFYAQKEVKKVKTQDGDRLVSDEPAHSHFEE